MRLTLQTLLLLIALVAPAGATQTHGDPEGLFVHQFSHIFFLFSMGLLIYWIRTRGLGQKNGWRHIQYAAILFMTWTMDAFATHLMDENYAWVDVTRMDAWHIHIDASNPFIIVFYYLLKLDHLWCVPAMLFMYMGLKRLNIEPLETPPLNNSPDAPLTEHPRSSKK
jgi:hypothetical protein